jgi:hypothetical protein
MYSIFHTETTLGWRVIRMCNLAKGQQKVACGEWREVHDPNTGELIGFQPVTPAEARGDRDLPSLASCASISMREMQANAGELGRSRTAGMLEEDRVSRRDPRNGTLLPAEDFVERTRAKVRVFAQVGPHKGDILRVWPK